jgi:hypothetical protein
MTIMRSNPRAKPRWATSAILLSFVFAMFGGAAVAAPGTEGNVVDYSQCANGKPGTSAPITDCDGWINGILNANNSQYGEDQVTAQRLILSLPSGGATQNRTLQLKWLVRKADTHAYDSLATWDHTQTSANACQNLSGPVAARCTTAISDGAAPYAIPSDPAEVSPNAGAGAPSTATSFHQLAGQQLEMYGLGVGGDIDSMVYGGLVDESGDLYQTATITYDVAGTLASARQVMLLFGGHLAAGGGPRSWGAGNGASDINGGPYHIKLIQVDGASIGNRDNQIMSSAILPLSVTVSTTLHQTDAAGADLVPSNNGTTLTLSLPAGGGGVDVKDYATASDPFASGTVTFRYYTSEASCLADTTGAGGTSAGSGALSGGVASGSTLHFSSIATYWFRAFLTGSDITLDSVSPCDEVLTLNQATTAATLLHERTTSGGDTDTTPSNNGKNITVLVGAFVNDTVTITPASASGTVTFKTYSTLADCGSDTNGTVQGSALALTAHSSTIQLSAAGTIYWRAFFSGTNGNLNSSSACVTGDNESVTAQVVASSLNTSPWAFPNDSATVSAAAGGNVAGSVAFKLYDTEANCLANTSTGLLFSDNRTLPGTQTSSTVSTRNGDPDDAITDYKVESSSTVWWRVTFTSTNSAQAGRVSACTEKIATTLTPDSSGGSAP